MSTAPKPMANKPKAQEAKKANNLFATVAIPISMVVAFILYFVVLGAPGNFQDAEKHKPANILGTMFLGGLVVPVLMSCLLIVLVFVVERFLTINQAKGSGSVPNFIRKVKYNLEAGDVSAALTECDKQRGSVANVVRSGLTKYREMSEETGLDKDQKVAAIQKEIEDATALELPMLEKNLVILATLASVSTLLGLFGTVLGMIRAFAALANAGAPDSTALATGISEALINTALGIGTSAVAIIMYNFFTTRIDGLTYGIDEAGFSIAQTFAAKHK